MPSETLMVQLCVFRVRASLYITAPVLSLDNPALTALTGNLHKNNIFIFKHLHFNTAKIVWQTQIYDITLNPDSPKC